MSVIGNYQKIIFKYKNTILVYFKTVIGTHKKEKRKNIDNILRFKFDNKSIIVTYIHTYNMLESENN